MQLNTDFSGRVGTSINNYVLFGFISIIVNYLAYACFDTSAERQIKRIRNKLFKSLLTQEMAFFDKNSPGEINSRLTRFLKNIYFFFKYILFKLDFFFKSNIETLKMGMGFKIPDFISLVGRGFGCFIFAMISAWKFSIVFLAIMPIITVCTVVLINFVKKFTIQEFKYYGMAGKIAQEVLSNLKTVLSFGSMKNEIQKYQDNLKQAENLAIKKGLYTGFFTGLSLFLFNICFAIALYYGIYLTRTDCKNYPPAFVIRSLMLMTTTTFAIGQSLPFLKDLAEAKGAAKTVFEIIKRKSSINIYDIENKIKPKQIIGNISFENLKFSYPQRSELKILNDFNLKIPASKTVALCGPSGCGKSTLIQLLQRFYEPNSGFIKIDDYDIKDLDLVWLRENMALVSQEPVLFSTTIK